LVIRRRPSRKLQRDPLDLLEQIQIAIDRFTVQSESVEGGAADSCEPTNPVHSHRGAFFDVGLGYAGRQRLSSQCLQNPMFLDSLEATLQKINFLSLLPDLPFQLGDFAFVPATFPKARKSVAGAVAELLAPLMQQIRVDSACLYSRHYSHRRSLPSRN
jgi:hypothetical protein